MKEKLDALEQAANTMAQQMYSQQGPQGGFNPNDFANNAGGSYGNDDVVDADFEEKH